MMMITFFKSTCNEIQYMPLNEIFSHYFARNTIVAIWGSLGLSDEEIINFTTPADLKTLKHYKAPLDNEQKKKLIGEKLSLAGLIQ